MDELRKYLTAIVGGETPGDTLKKLADFPMVIYVDPQGSDEMNREGTEAWCDWLRDLGDRLNAACAAHAE